jgi:hypothetical protein
LLDSLMKIFRVPCRRVVGHGAEAPNAFLIGDAV